MGRNRGVSKFSEQDIRQLERNSNVQRVSEKSISYSPTFKLATVKSLS